MKRLSIFLIIFFLLLGTGSAYADYGIVDVINLAPFVPMVLLAFMDVAMSGYKFFVGDGTGIIYLLVWGWLGMYIALTLIKMYFPSNWLEFFGMKGNDEMWKGETSGIKIGEDLLKPMLRAIIAVTIMLQVEPKYITDFIVDPFLRFGAIYTDGISAEVIQSNAMFGNVREMPECPQELITKGYISQEGCDFLIKPVAQISHANNIVIKRGVQFFMKGLGQLITIVSFGRGFLDLITGAILIITFVSNNFFMALLVIQGIFNFGMALILYPFKVLAYVVKDGDDWINPWPAFEMIIDALKKLVITMIACMFIMAVNIAAIKALFNWNSSVFSVASGGSASSNVPVAAASGAMGFGQHLLTILSAVLTFWLMAEIFRLTREQLNKYSRISDELYKKVASDTGYVWGKTKTAGKTIGNVVETGSNWIKKIRGWFK
ncbi:MAG: hypothetical protein FWG80_04545 [Alphaproteobacteria bacterium]|nr:hypothetical protein [Alphaproteobacteria bacterium]